MKTTFSILFSAVLILAANSPIQARLGGLHHRDTKKSQNTAVYRWASSGGGWRSMVGLMAFGNIFSQAGLITESSSEFTSVSTISGASWFSTQFFYSPQFFRKVTQSSPDEIASFVLQWMNSYQNFFAELQQYPKCDAVANVTDTPTRESLAALCNLLVDLDGDWAEFVKEMMAKASEDYGDIGLMDRAANAANRIKPLSKTDLYIQTSLAPNSRIRSVEEGVLLGPIENKGDEIYSLPICVQYSVTSEDIYYFTSDPEGTLQLPTFLDDDVTDDLDYPRGYEDFGIFPIHPPSNSISPLPNSAKPTGLTLSEPFHSNPNLAQIAAASSAVEGVYSPLVPSTFSQYLSVRQSNIEGPKRIMFDKLVDELYTKEIFDDLSVCSQWPHDCGETDGRFIDGYYTDQASLALNIGQYQTRMNGDMSKILKIVLTNTNEYNYGPEGILSYFNTTYNENVAPGGFLWPDDEATYLPLPTLSPQIFDLYMDVDGLSEITKPIPGLNVTTAVISARTLENPSYHVKGGQQVEILLLSLNSMVPTVILGTHAIEAYTQPLVDMAYGISSSQELLCEVKTFMNN